jgi:hypothetical protein
MQSSPAIRQHFHLIRRRLKKYRAVPLWALRAYLIGLVAALALNLYFGDARHALLPIIPAIVLACAFFYYLAEVGNDRIPCPNCRAITKIGLTWVCGFCSATNENVLYPWKRTFCEACTNCKSAPHSVFCWRCQKPIVFQDGRDPS